MNAARRAQIAAVRTALDEIKTRVEDARIEVDAIYQDEEDALEGMPESFQQGERGERAQEAIGALDGAHSVLEDILSALDDVDASLSQAEE